jgi:hypothetical protein
MLALETSGMHSRISEMLRNVWWRMIVTRLRSSKLVMMCKLLRVSKLTLIAMNEKRITADHHGSASIPELLSCRCDCTKQGGSNLLYGW